MTHACSSVREDARAALTPNNQQLEQSVSQTAPTRISSTFYPARALTRHHGGVSRCCGDGEERARQPTEVYADKPQHQGCDGAGSACGEVSCEAKMSCLEIDSYRKNSISVFHHSSPYTE